MDDIIFAGWVQHQQYVFKFCNGRIKAEKTKDIELQYYPSFGSNTYEFMKSTMVKCGYYYETINPDHFALWLLRFDGKTMNEFCEYLKARGERLREIKRKKEDLNNRFKNNIIIGLENEIDVFETGFSVRVLCNSQTTQQKRKKFLEENKREFLIWIIEAIQEKKRITNKIGDVCFYEPTEIIFLKIPEVEIKFEVKGINA